jgi:hypothetical protein
LRLCYSWCVRICQVSSRVNAAAGAGDVGRRIVVSLWRLIGAGLGQYGEYLPAKLIYDTVGAVLRQIVFNPPWLQQKSPCTGVDQGRSRVPLLGSLFGLVAEDKQFNPEPATVLRQG